MNLFTIAPHTPFLPCLVDAVMDGRLLSGWDRAGPFWLSDVTIILPTRRAQDELAEAFARHPAFGGLLPDMRTFGGEVKDEEPFLPPFDTEPDPKPASALRRRLVLSELVAAWAKTEEGREAFSTPPTAAEIFSMAESLGRLIDDLHIEERSAADIRALGAEMALELGNYWQQTLKFLDIALEAWPVMLARLDMADPAALRRRRLDRQAKAAPFLFSDRPVIAAGSTGSIPATARLLKTIAGLLRGAVVLPGLDRTMSPAMLASFTDPDNNPHGHPQYGLAQLLNSFGAELGQVRELCAAEHPRTRLINLALAPTGQTALWPEQRFSPASLDAALDGVSIIRARNEDEEARALALAARDALDSDQCVGIVTPDSNLARRIAAELKRFDIVVDDAAGTPLYHAPAGRLARQLLNLVQNNCAAVDLLALLRNRATTLGLARGAVVALADDIDLGLLRGQRPAPGIAGIRAMLAAHLGGKLKYPARTLSPQRGEEIAVLLARLETALAPLFALMAERALPASALAGALGQAMAAVGPGTPLPGRPEFEAWVADMQGLNGEGHRFAPRGLEDVLAALMTGIEVRHAGLEERRNDIAIWGQLEARLMSPDVLILGALNEDKWPATADPGPWLSRGMRLAAGLEPPERQQGLAAHDFAQAMGNGRIILAYAERVGSSPALASRLIQRLDAFVGEGMAAQLRARGDVWTGQARRLDAVPRVVPARRPAPNPPIGERPRKLSVTEIETLMRSPYDLYAKHVLRLKPLDALGEDPDARERGTIIHAIFARFVFEERDPAAPEALTRLMEIATEEFAGLEAIGERRDIWLRRFATAAEQFLDYERGRSGLVEKRHAEISGRWELKLAEPFAITGQADRVDLLKNGTLEILDFKTGSPPSSASMKAFEAPQLPVEAMMALNAGLKNIQPADTSALTYIKIGLGPDAFKPSAFATADGMSVMAVAEEVFRRVQLHIEHFLFHQTALPARLLPLKGQRFAGAYDHLARVDEWTAVDGEDEA
ncbi:ATP-dependent helicase/nuclease subunit B [Devosia subaequoris]|uniref:ATP-dependent helicase/nuclease subunit B n=1 Tax=Devosia subaequoris TaxID=395930 RepID=A0A7W6INA3_9HYPH|nr:double-strand break repair protein AddB [Devosia subaequoris]MBB4052312.1 ATP-dependent helicase/nuclease subunit B [Devosia subaequoris]MCP1209474.1 double-strand break repair protein AddB [Devosia subaequoris]